MIPNIDISGIIPCHPMVCRFSLISGKELTPRKDGQCKQHQ